MQISSGHAEVQHAPRVNPYGAAGASQMQQDASLPAVWDAENGVYKVTTDKQASALFRDDKITVVDRKKVKQDLKKMEGDCSFVIVKGQLP